MQMLDESDQKMIAFFRQPQTNDILCGRGHGVGRHPGNIHYRSLVENLREKYSQCSRKGRKDISQQILNQVKALRPPGRFLRFHTKKLLWYEIDDKSPRGALDKISRALREKVPKRLETLETAATQTVLEKPLSTGVSQPATSSDEEVNDIRLAGDADHFSCNCSFASIGSMSLDGIEDPLAGWGYDVLNGATLCKVFLDEKETSDDLLSRTTRR